MNDGDKEEIDPMDLDFDFEGYFENFRNGDLSEAERSEFDMRVIGLFCRDVFRSEGKTGAVSPWAANYVAEQLHKVLGGCDWSQQLRLPWVPVKPIYAKSDGKRVNLFISVKRIMKECPELTVVAALERAADENCVAYSTVRAAYYDTIALSKKAADIPKKGSNK